MRRLLLAAALLLAPAAHAQVVRQDLTSYATKADVAATVKSVNGQTGDVAVPVYTDAQAITAARSISAVISGTFTVATLPTCNATTNVARYAYVSDLGGGADMVLCAGGNWKHIRLGAPASVTATSGTVNLTPLTSAPIQMVTGASIVGTLSFAIASAGLYDGEMFYIRRPGVLTGSIGVALASGGPSIPILGNSTTVVVYSAACSCLQQLQ